MEALAAQEHESWANWTKWMLQEMNKEADGDFELEGLPCVERWRRQAATPYADLSEKEKESDRKVVREKLALYRHPNLPALIEKAIETATTAGMEFVAEADGGSWTGRGVGPEDDDADAAREKLESALGIEEKE
jgi:hypothetical protein